jgi:excisionase family DNA binding protein
MSTTPERALSEVRFLTVAEVASVMRVSKMTVYRLVHNGELPAVRVGRSFRVPEQAVHDYLRDSYVVASSQAEILDAAAGTARGVLGLTDVAPMTYEVKLLQPDGRLARLVLDARTAEVLSQRRRVRRASPHR